MISRRDPYPAQKKYPNTTATHKFWRHQYSHNVIQQVDCIEGTEDQACEDSDDNFEEETFPPPIRLFTKGTPDKGYSQEALSGKEQNPRTLYQTCVCTLESQEVMYKTCETFW